MEKVKIKSSIRTELGKEEIKRMRKKDCVPAVVYGKDLNLVIKLEHDAIKTLKNIHFSESTIVNMEVEGSDKKALSVMIKDAQFNPVTDQLMHVDFIKVALDEKIHVKVPISLEGEAAGVKEGGTLDQMLWDLEIEVLPTNIPEKISVDVTELTIGHSLHVRDIKISSGLKVLTSEEETVAAVSAMKAEQEPTEEEILAGEEEAKEPEVLKEKKEEEK